jgi:ferredoxin
MKAVVDHDACVGCGLCVDTCPEVFRLEEAVAQVIVDEVPPEAVAQCQEASEACPVDAIKLVD